jgi:selenide,water dikinase
MAANLARYAGDRTLARCRARGHPFVLIPLGEKRAIVSTPPLVAEGEWVWRLKERIDRRFVTRFRLSVAQPAATVDEERLS